MEEEFLLLLLLPPSSSSSSSSPSSSSSSSSSSFSPFSSSSSSSLPIPIGRHRTGQCLWPILGRVSRPNRGQPYAVGVLSGSDKLGPLDVFLGQCVSELKDILAFDRQTPYTDDIVKAELANAIRDTPARLYLQEGRPSSRYVLLKGLDERGFHFFTSASSQKGREMETNKHVCLLFYWEPLKRQVRINGEASLLPEEEVVSYFSSRPKSSQVAAFVSDQSAPVPSDAHLLSEFKRAEKEFASTPSVPKPKSWVGYSVMPDSVEFWQGQTNRLHDRIHFFRPNSSTPVSEFAMPADDGWYYERLAP
nr:unnamed protein product [Spirometra erinaceieuropaei]